MAKDDRSAGDRVLVQVRLPKDLVKRIDHLSIDHDLYRAQMMERLVREGIKTYDRGGPSGASGGS